MTCPICDSDLYDSGHAHPDCPGEGQGCQDCGWGCDLDFVEDGVCDRLPEYDDEDDEVLVP